MTKPPNYISPLPPKEQIALYRWYTISVYAVFGLIIVLMLFNCYQYLQAKKTEQSYNALNHSLQALQQNVQKAEQLQNTNKILDQKLAKIKGIHNQPFNPKIYLENIAQHTPLDMCLLEFTCAKKSSISFHGYSRKAESVIAFLQTLQQSPHFASMQIASLTPAQSPSNDGQWFQFTLKGTLKMR